MTKPILKTDVQRLVWLYNSLRFRIKHLGVIIKEMLRTKKAAEQMARIRTLLCPVLFVLVKQVFSVEIQIILNETII